MAVKATELVVKMRAAIAELDATREAHALTASGDALALVKRRIQQKRVDADGSKLGTYSRAKVPYWFFKGKETLGNAAAKVKQLYKQFGYFASYYDWKVVNNQSNPDINLTFTGRMMNSLKSFVLRRSRDTTTVSWVAGNQAEQDKYEYSSDRFPRAFALDPTEVQLIETANERRIERITKNLFQ